MNLPAKIFFITALLMVLPILSLPFFFDNPKDTHDLTSSEFAVRESGLPPIVYYPLKFATTTLYIMFVVFSLYADKLVKTPPYKKKLIRFRRCVFVSYYSLLSASLLMIIQLPLSILALSRISGIQFADIIHSSLPAYSACLLVAFASFPFFHKQAKFHRTHSLSDILSRLNSAQPPAYQQN